MLKKITLLTLTLLTISSFSIAQDLTPIGDSPNYIVLKINGLDGNSSLNNHIGEIEVLTWSWSMSQSGTTHVGGGGGAGKSFVEDMVLTKYVDKASPSLLLACLNGGHFPEAVLTVVSGGDQPFDYLVITMSDVLVTSVGTGGSDDFSLTTEKVTLNFAKVKYSYTPREASGVPGEAIHFTWDIEKNTQE